MISAAELAAMQATATSSLDLTCTITTYTHVSDGAGGQTNVAHSSAVIACSLAQPSQQLLQNYDYLIGSLSAWVVTLPYGTSITDQDDIAVSGLDLKVHVVLAPESYQTCVRVLAAEVR